MGNNKATRRIAEMYPATAIQDNNFLTGEPNAVDADGGITVTTGSCSQPSAPTPLPPPLP